MTPTNTPLLSSLTEQDIVTVIDPTASDALITFTKALYDDRGDSTQEDGALPMPTKRMIATGQPRQAYDWSWESYYQRYRAHKDASVQESKILFEHLASDPPTDIAADANAESGPVPFVGILANFRARNEFDTDNPHCIGWLSVAEADDHNPTLSIHELTSVDLGMPVETIIDAEGPDKRYPSRNFTHLFIGTGTTSHDE